MTDNSRSSLLRRARTRTAGIALGALAGTGLLTLAIATTSQQAASGTVDDTGGTTGSTTRSGSSGSSSTSSDSSGSSTGSGVGSSTSSGSSDGGTQSS